MAEPLTIITSIVSVATGVAGAVMGYIAFRRTGAYKALDLRVQLRKDESALRAQLERLPGLLERADGSRQAVLAANGMLGSGAQQIWKTELAADREALAALRAAWLQPTPDYAKLNSADLESRTVAVHETAGKAGGLAAKYTSALAEDDQLRAEKRQGMNQRR
jgi:hypothetical protein